MPLDRRLVAWNLHADLNGSKRHSMRRRVILALVIAEVLVLGATIKIAAVSSPRHVAAVGAATPRAHRDAPSLFGDSAARGDAADDDYVEELRQIVGDERSADSQAAPAALSRGH